MSRALVLDCPRHQRREWWLGGELVAWQPLAEIDRLRELPDDLRECRLPEPWAPGRWRGDASHYDEPDKLPATATEEEHGPTD